MLTNLFVKTFKSLDDVAVDLGRVNVFIGANGSGKTNLLEALGILSAAANGKGLIYLTRQWQIRARFGRTGPATPCRWPGKRAVAATLQAKKALW